MCIQSCGSKEKAFLMSWLIVTIMDGCQLEETRRDFSDASVTFGAYSHWHVPLAGIH